jgi:pSer/pThr/pTyr-binding forkhead associated (FHA) protein
MWRISALDREGREVGHFDLAQGELTIGRDTDRQLILPSASVSRRHARIVINGGQPSIVDDGSSNGVSVDGVRIGSPTMVGPMNRIDVAEFRITVVNLAEASRPQAAQPPADAIRLVAEGGPYDGRVFDLPGGAATVGRALENELVFDDPSLSRKHARITREGPGRLGVEDLGSSNGTYVNGRKVGRGSAGPGDAIQFGDLLFRVEGTDYSGTRAVENVGGGGQMIAVAVFGVVTAAVLVGVVIALLRKPPVIQANGKEAIAKISAKADNHLRAGRALYRDRKYSEAKQELDAALDADPANQEARKLSRLASRGPDDDRAYATAVPSLKIGDRKGLEQALRWYDEMTDGSSQRTQLQAKLAPALEVFGLDRCAHRGWADCAWSTCKAFEVAPPEAPPDARVKRALDDAEKHLQKDKTYVPCRSAR